MIFESRSRSKRTTLTTLILTNSILIYNSSQNSKEQRVPSRSGNCVSHRLHGNPGPNYCGPTNFSGCQYPAPGASQGPIKNITALDDCTVLFEFDTIGLTSLYDVLTSQKFRHTAFSGSDLMKSCVLHGQVQTARFYPTNTPVSPVNSGRQPQEEVYVSLAVLPKPR